MSEHWTPVMQMLYPEEYIEYLQRQADFRFKMNELFPIIENTSGEILGLKEKEL